MKTLLLVAMLFSFTAQAKDATCNNRAVTVVVNTVSAQRLIDFVGTIDSMPLVGRVLHQTEESSTVQVTILGDDLNGHDAFDVAAIIRGIQRAEQDGLGIRRIMADVCYSNKDPGGHDSGNVGTIGH